jgi:hypothetical protein
VLLCVCWLFSLSLYCIYLYMYCVAPVLFHPLYSIPPVGYLYCLLLTIPTTGCCIPSPFTCLFPTAIADSYPPVATIHLCPTITATAATCPSLCPHPVSAAHPPTAYTPSCTFGAYHVSGLHLINVVGLPVKPVTIHPPTVLSHVCATV